MILIFISQSESSDAGKNHRRPRIGISEFMETLFTLIFSHVMPHTQNLSC